MKRKAKALLLVLIFIPIILVAQQVTTTIESIEKNPGKYFGQTVTVLGFVEQYIESPTGTKYYMLKGDHAGIIKVNCTSQPTTKKKYYVTGLVQKDLKNTRPIIAETKRILHSYAGKDSDNDGILDKYDKCPNQAETMNGYQDSDGCPDEKPKHIWVYFVIGGLLLILLALVIIQIVIKGQQKGGNETAGGKGSGNNTDGSSSGKETNPIDLKKTKPRTNSQFSTIKITNTVPKTMRFIPGKLKVISDRDKGKEFRIAGYPTPKGNIVTIGRASVKGDREFAHIQIDDKFATVSRKQAEFREKDGKLFIKNLSSTNFTQINGEQLKESEIVEVNYGDVIRMGELEFEYTK